VASDFPKLEIIFIGTATCYIGYNKPLQAVELPNFPALMSFKANETSLRNFMMNGDYPNLENLDISWNPLELLDLSKAYTPRLRVLFVSFCKLKSFEFPSSCIAL
jgi:Leucine-rich repeat (LRR) protein